MPRKSRLDETVAFGVRLTKTDREWLDAMSSANGVEMSQLIRWAVESLRQYVQENDGRLHLPIDLKQLLEASTKAWPKLGLPGTPLPPRMNEPPKGEWKAAKRGSEGQTKSPSAGK